MQPVMRHHGGVLSALQDQWMLKPCLTHETATRGARPYSLTSAVSAPLRAGSTANIIANLDSALSGTFSSGIAAPMDGSSAPLPRGLHC